MENNDRPEFPSKNTPRGDFNLLGVKRQRKSNSKVILVIGAGICVVLIAISSIFFFAYRAMQANTPETVDESKVKADATLSAKPKADEEIAKRREAILRKKREEEEKAKREKEQQQLEQEQDKNSKTNSQQQLKGATEQAQPSAGYLRKMTGGLIAQETGGGDSGSGSSTASRSDNENDQSRNAVLASQAENAGLSDGGGNSGRGELSSLQNSKYSPSKAFLSPNRKFLLKRKTNVQCTLYTAVKTDHQGFVSCYLTRPVFSSDGSIILAEAGAELNGEQRIEIKPGQTSVFTTWTDMETSGGVRADLNALGTGPLGDSGTEAYVDNHYGKRFGGAVMLSFIQDAFASAANSTKRNNSTYSFDNSESNAENMATKTLENSINIPPTGYVLPGTVINVIVAQDIDFSSVFKTRRVN